MSTTVQEWQLQIVRMNLNLALKKLRELEDETESPDQRRVLRQRIIELVNLIEAI